MIWTEERERELRSRWNAGESKAKIAKAMGVTANSIVGKSRAMALNFRPGARSHHLTPQSPALLESRTRFPTMVREPSGHVLMPGTYSRKLGARVTKGAWSGLPIYSLTLEERATCPTTCPLLLDCYGNNMHHAKRFRHGPELEAAVAEDLWWLDAKHPRGFVVRLHILGDWYSVAYAGFWRDALAHYPSLRVWGYTAWQPSTPIGRAVQAVRRAYPHRFAVRVSGAAKGFRAIVIDKPEDKPAGAIVCPVERPSPKGLPTNCGNCGLCWTSPRTIAFLAHTVVLWVVCGGNQFFS